ncbi:MAG: hypothetical protein AAF587_10040 [Bacteroidota bacterium]
MKTKFFEVFRKQIQSSKHPLFQIFQSFSLEEGIQLEKINESFSQLNFDTLQDEKISEELIMFLGQNMPEILKNPEAYLAYVLDEITTIEEAFESYSEEMDVEDSIVPHDPLSVELLSLKATSHLINLESIFEHLAVRIVQSFFSWANDSLLSPKEGKSISKHPFINYFLDVKLKFLEENISLVFEKHRIYHFGSSPNQALSNLSTYLQSHIGNPDSKLRIFENFFLFGMRVQLSKETADNYLTELVGILKKHFPESNQPIVDSLERMISKQPKGNTIFQTQELALFIHYLQKQEIILSLDFLPTAQLFSALTGRSWDRLRRKLGQREIEIIQQKVGTTPGASDQLLK